MKYIIKKDFEPYGFLSEDRKIRYFQEKYKTETEPWIEYVFKRDHQRTDKEIVDRGTINSNPTLGDIIVYLQTIGYTIEPIDAHFVEMMEKELDKL